MHPTRLLLLKLGDEPERDIKLRKTLFFMIDAMPSSGIVADPTVTFVANPEPGANTESLALRRQRQVNVPVAAKLDETGNAIPQQLDDGISCLQREVAEGRASIAAGARPLESRLVERLAKVFRTSGIADQPV